MSEKIGKTKEEIDSGLMLECRKLIKNIINFGINEQQKIHLIYLLSLELESRDSMQIIIKAVEKIKNLNHNVKFSLTTDKEDYNKDSKGKLLDV